MNYSLGHNFFEMVSRILFPDFEASIETHFMPKYNIRVEEMLICHNSKPDVAIDNSNVDTMSDCPICLEKLDANNSVTNTCSHSICKTCTMTYLETQFRQNHFVCCSVCRHPLYLLESCDEKIADNLFAFVENCRTLTNDEPLPEFHSIYDRPRRSGNRRTVARTVNFDDYENILED
jgi:hypothetical protein